MPDPKPPKTREEEKKDRRKLIAGIVAAIFLLLILLVAYRSLRTEPEPPFDASGLRVSNIKATLDPPFTHYEVFASAIDSRPLTYNWTLEPEPAQELCNDLTVNGPKADWRHDGENCSHAGVSAHPGRITVVVSDGIHTLTRVDTHGAEDYDPKPLYP